MTRKVTAVIVAVSFTLSSPAHLLGQVRSRGSVSAASRGTVTRSGNTTSATGRYGNVSGSRTVSKTSEGYNINKQVQTRSGYSKEVNKDINVEDRTIDRSSTARNPWGQSASRDRTVEGHGGYATVEGHASTSTGRYASGQGVAGRNVYGQPAYSGTVNTKYNGRYATAGARNPYGGWTTATAGPYGGRITTTLPSGYRTTTYYGRPYYTYGGAYYRPYTYGGVHYYYPVPAPYYCYYSSPPIGAMVVMVAGIAYLVAKDGSYSRQTTSSEGTVVYQSVPAPAGAKLTTLPAERVLVTVAGTTYYLATNTFYKRVMEGSQERFVVVTPPAGVVFVAALPADFEVVQLNTMYFAAQGRYYVPFLSSDGKEKYVMVDRPPQPAAAAPQAAPAQARAKAATPAATQPRAAATTPEPAIRRVAESLVVPSGTLLVVRFASDMSSATATVGDRVQGFLDQDLAANGRLVTPRGARVYGVVSSVERGSKMGGTPSLTVTLTDMAAGDRIVPIKTQPVKVTGTAATGARKLVGGTGLGAAIGAIAGGGKGAAIGAAVGAGVGGAAAAAGSSDAAVLPAQRPTSFSLAVPMQIDVMTSVAVRSGEGS